MLFILPELLFHVLENGYYAPSGKPDYKHLRACALVCRAWSGPAQSLLFCSVTKLRDHNIHTFHAALLSSAAQGRPLGNCVRTLDMLTSGVNGKSYDISIVVELLQACPQLYELALGFYGIGLEGEILERLRVAGQGLKALSLVYYGTESPILYHLLSIWPNIQFLKIDLASHGTSLPWDITAAPMLQSNANDAGEFARQNGAGVCLYSLTSVMAPAPEVLTWLLASSVNSLRVLDLQRVPPLTELHIFARHAPRLRSLRVRSYNEDTVALLHMCTALEELVLYGLELPPRCPLAPNLPPANAIQHLSFTIQAYSRRVTLQPIIDAVDALPNLKVLTCNKSVRRLQYKEYEILEGRCRIKGVEVVESVAPNWVVGIKFYSNAPC
jgi:hypothetical protein